MEKVFILVGLVVFMKVVMCLKVYIEIKLFFDIGIDILRCKLCVCFFCVNYYVVNMVLFVL